MVFELIHDSQSWFHFHPETDGKGVVLGKKSDLQSMDYPHELPKWITLKWSMPLKFSD